MQTSLGAESSAQQLFQTIKTHQSCLRLSSHFLYERKRKREMKSEVRSHVSMQSIHDSSFLPKAHHCFVSNFASLASLFLCFQLTFIHSFDASFQRFGISHTSQELTSKNCDKCLFGLLFFRSQKSKFAALALPSFLFRASSILRIL